MDVAVRTVGLTEGGAGLECWVSQGKAFLLIRPGTGCESVTAGSLDDGGVINVLVLWPGDEKCLPLYCTESLPPHSYLVEASIERGVGRAVFRVFRAVDCGGRGVDVVGLVGECVAVPQPQTPR